MVLLLAALIGGDTLTELRQSFAAAEAECEGGVSPRVAPFADLRDIGALLQRAGLALPVTDVDRVVVRYDNAFALMNDLRRMGATNILLERRHAPTRRATMLRMVQIYAERFSDPDGRIRATFDIVWLSAWAPDESQPKPLRPGSATASLEEAVKRGQKNPSWRASRSKNGVASLVARHTSWRSAGGRVGGALSVLQQQILQMRDQRQIRRRHRIVAQLIGAHPGELLALARRSTAFQRRQT